MKRITDGENMKVVLLAGGAGTRIAEETGARPKPMVEIGGMPIIWHIMKEYSYYGYNDFIICAGYKQEIIKKWFTDYFLYTSDITVDFSKENKLTIHEQTTEPWKVTIVDTGVETMTGGRLKRVQKYVGDETFMMTYGDGVCDVDIKDLVRFHGEHGKMATLTSVIPDQQKGLLEIAQDNSVKAFREKNITDSTPINAGYMVLQPAIFEYLKGDDTVLETHVLSELADKGELMSYSHNGFWHCMDTLREKNELEALIKAKKAPWMKWNEHKNK